MKHTWAVVLSVLLVLGTASAYAGEATPRPTSSVLGWLDGAARSAEDWIRETGELEVAGRAVRTVSPDTVAINVGTRIEDKDEKVAKDKASAIINDVIAALRALGVEDGQMATSGYNITRKGDSGKLLSTSGYIVAISLRVTVQDFELINQIIDAAVEKGANEVGSIHFSYSKEGELYQETLLDAIAAARRKAEAMAAAAGVELRTLLLLREGSAGTAYHNTFMAKEASSSYGGGTQIMEGEIEISASVTMVFQTK